MLLVLLYWIYLLWIFGSYGVLLECYTTGKAHPVVTLFLGSFVVTTIASIYSFFGALSTVFEVVLFVFSIVIALYLYKSVVSFFRSLKAKVVELSTFSIIILFTLITLACAKSAGAPFLIDNESYYLQTIQWLDSYGLVKGIANLHTFLMQFSGWHLLQSATNVDFLNLSINDLSSFTLVLTLIYCVEKLDASFKKKELPFFNSGFYLIFCLFLFQFISVPSPDIPVFLFSLIIFNECLEWTQSTERDLCRLVPLFLFGVFAVYIKLTAILIVLFPIACYALFKSKLSRKRSHLLVTPLVIGTLTFLLFVAKNHIISGYAFFPLKVSLGSPDWMVPASIISFYKEITLQDAFQLTYSQQLPSSFIDKLLLWLQLSGVDGIFNKSIAVVLLVFPILLWIKKWNKILVVLYALSLLQFLIIWFNGPQFRFFFLFFALLVVVLLSTLFKKEWVLKSTVIFSTALVAIPLLIPFNISTLSSTSFLATLAPFQAEHLVTPHANTRYIDLAHKQERLGNLDYNTPIDSPFFWGAGDCKVPCVNEIQIEYLKKELGVYPQQRFVTIKDGFYSQKITDE